MSALILFLAACAPDSSPPVIPATPNASILLITIDALRVNRLGCYGYEAADTPNLDALAAEGIRFTNAFTQSPLSSVAHATLLTGLYPAAHGVREDAVYALTEDAVTLAENLDHARYETGAFVASAALAARFGFDQGFGVFDDGISALDARWPAELAGAPTLRHERPADAVVHAARPWLTESRDVPFFAWVHVTDCTAPYDPPGGRMRITEAASDSLGGVVVHAPSGSYPASLSTLSDAYDDEVAYVDAAIGALVASVPSDCIILVAGSHGESLGEHGVVGHGEQLFDEAVRVPLILRAPGLSPAGGTIDALVELADVSPTLLDMVGVTPLTAVQGRSLRSGEPRASVFAETHRPLERGTGTERVMLRTRRSKALFGAGDVLVGLYDVATDPAERTNRLSEERDRGRRLRGRLRNRREVRESATGPVDPAVEAHLRSLGYVGGADTEPDLERTTALRQAARALHRRDWKRAETFLLPLLAKAPNDEWVRIRLATAYGGAGRWEACRREWATLAAGEAADPIVFLGLADAERRAGDPEGEIAALTRAVAAAPLFLDAHVRLVERLLERGRRREAEALVADATRVAPADPRLPILRSVVGRGR